MNPRASDKEYKTGNRELVLFFKLHDVVPYKTLCVGRRKVFCYDMTEIFERKLDEKWRSGAPIMVDLRMVFQAESWFNSVVHDGI